MSSARLAPAINKEQFMRERACLEDLIWLKHVNSEYYHVYGANFKSARQKYVRL